MFYFWLLRNFTYSSDGNLAPNKFTKRQIVKCVICAIIGIWLKTPKRFRNIAACLLAKCPRDKEKKLWQKCSGKVRSSTTRTKQNANASQTNATPPACKTFANASHATTASPTKKKQRS